MRYCILPWDPKCFDLSGCLEYFGFVDWRQILKLKDGDIVFIYAKKPLGQIAYMFEVSQANMETAEDDSKFVTGELAKSKYYARLKLIAIASENNSELSYGSLKQHGLKSQLQGGIYIDGELKDHILSNIGVTLATDGVTFSEGKSQTVTQTIYERDPAARQRCLAKYNNEYKCQICGFDFLKTYGELGRNFIHVHHISPLAENNGVAVETNPGEDLLPVCPNCHAMLHRKLNGKYLTPTELKHLIGYARQS